MRILLADDERLVRLSIRSMIEELYDDSLIEEPVIREVTNGRELEAALSSFSPHLAFVDIQMPGPSGLDVIEKTAPEHPGTAWVLLTGFAEFPYAKRAIELGVLEYLVKPASSGDLLKVIQQAQKIVGERSETSALITSAKLSSLLHQTTSSEFDLWFAPRVFLGGLLLPTKNSYENNPAAEEEPSSLSHVQTEVGTLLSAFNFSHGGKGVSAVQLLSDEGNIIIALSLQKASSRAAQEFFSSLEEALSVYLRKLTTPELTLSWHPLPSVSTAQEFLDTLLASEQELMGERDLFRPSPSRHAGSSAKRDEQVEKALTLVQEKFSEEVGLAQIADTLGVNANYLSGEFKRYTGVNFTEYITSLRMEKAQELLKQPGMSVKQAAQELGYMSSRYFSKLFTQTYGQKPSDFIEYNR